MQVGEVQNQVNLVHGSQQGETNKGVTNSAVALGVRYAAVRGANALNHLPGKGSQFDSVPCLFVSVGQAAVRQRHFLSSFPSPSHSSCFCYFAAGSSAYFTLSSLVNKTL